MSSPISLAPKYLVPLAKEATRRVTKWVQLTHTTVLSTASMSPLVAERHAPDVKALRKHGFNVAP